MANEHFGSNLKFLCGHYRFVAEVCRRRSFRTPRPIFLDIGRGLDTYRMAEAIAAHLTQAY